MSTVEFEWVEYHVSCVMQWQSADKLLLESMHASYIWSSNLHLVRHLTDFVKFRYEVSYLIDNN